jgi:phosphoribosylaminoimidazole-succinocarboxamide synthase
MVIRGYLTGHAWRTYKSGKREICGVKMPDGMVEHQRFPSPIITPSTKANFGHDEDISREDVLRNYIVEEKDYIKLEEYTRAVFQRGSEMADERGLILVDTKYEFGKKNGKIFLIDEIHTPDSSRYFYKDGYQQRLENGEPQKQLSKEFVREWLIENGFQGKDGQKIPEMNNEFVDSVSNRYIELFEKVSGSKFEKPDNKNPLERIKKNVLEFFN